MVMMTDDARAPKETVLHLSPLVRPNARVGSKGFEGDSLT
jgi:hypothetical protein